MEATLALHSPDLDATSAFSCDLALFMALPEEAAQISRRMRCGLRGGDGRLHGHLAERSVFLQITGQGPQAAELAARRLLSAHRPRFVMCAGLAGGLDDGLERGRLIVAERTVDESGTCELSANPDLLTRAERLGATRASLLSLPRVICTVHEKRRLSARASAVDMESLAVARVAQEEGLPFVAIRVISDTSHEEFPINLNRYLRPDGGFDRGRLVLNALCRRGGLRFLLGLGATARTGANSLADFVERMLRQFPSSDAGTLSVSKTLHSKD